MNSYRFFYSALAATLHVLINLHHLLADHLHLWFPRNKLRFYNLEQLIVKMKSLARSLSDYYLKADCFHGSWLT